MQIHLRKLITGFSTCSLSLYSSVLSYTINNIISLPLIVFFFTVVSVTLHQLGCQCRASFVSQHATSAEFGRLACKFAGLEKIAIWASRMKSYAIQAQLETPVPGKHVAITGLSSKWSGTGFSL